MSQRANVLIVDDEPANRKLLEGLVRLLGYQPILARGGAEALALVEQGSVDVILLDMMMPGMSGLEVLERLAGSGLHAGLPVVVVSALTDRESRLAALERGATEFLNKPIDRHELAARLQTVVRLKTLHDQVKMRLRDSERLHQALMAGAAVPIVVLDLNGRVVEANAAAQMLHETDSGPLLGQLYSGLLSPDDGPRAERIFQELLETGTSASALALRVPSGGRELLLDVSASVVETGEGRLIICIGRDVTEERLAQSQLALRESELSRAQSVARLGSMHFDKVTGQRHWSAETYRILGLPEDTPPSFEAYISCIHPQDRPYAMAMRDRVLNGHPAEFEARLVGAGASPEAAEERWARIRIVNEVDPQGSLVIIATLQDITQLKQSELAREASLRFSQEVLDSLTGQVAILDEHGRILATNRGWRESALARGGNLESTSEGANYLAVCNDTPEGQEVGRSILLALAGQCQPKAIEYECSNTSEEQWFWCRINRLNLEGPPRVAIYHHDVTSLKQAEMRAAERAQRLDLLVANLPLVLWEGEARRQAESARWTGQIQWVSDNIERVLGATSEDLVKSLDWLPRIHPDDQARLKRLLSALDSENSRQWLQEFRWCRPDGSEVNLQIGATSEPQADGRLALMGFALDVSESRKLAAVLLQAQKMEAIGQLTGGIAHDFNNILGVILSYAVFVRDDLPVDDQRRQDIDQVIQATDKATALTRQLLDFSRPQTTSKCPIDLNQSLAGLLKMLQRCVGETVKVEIVASPRSAVVRMDPVHLDQILMNLAVNARDAMAGGGRLTFSVDHLSEPGGVPSAPSVRLTVRDTGAGMDATTLGRIFDPFFTTKEVGKGTGLGLATCYALIKESEGTISVESSPGEGTSFMIDLPLCHEPLVENLPSDSVGWEAVGERHVLVVEDDDALRQAAARILQFAGYQVSQAENGVEAIHRINELGRGLDLVFTDVVMPGGGGYLVAEHARRHIPGLAVLLTSGYLDRQLDVLERPEELPLLWKPYTAASLLRAVHTALNNVPRDEADCEVPKASPPGPSALESRKPLPVAPETAAPETGGILLVEDDEGQREAYARALRAAGFEVAMASSGEEALGLLERLSVDALVTDIGLPDMDGLRLLRRARASDPDLPVLLITGAPSVESATTAVHNRAVGYLAKPFPLEVLVQEVSLAVEAGQVSRLQRKLLAARAGADEFLLDLPGTRRSLESALQGLRVVFQPIVRSNDRSIFGFEALLRSDEPTLSTPPKVIAAADVLSRTDEVGLAVRGAIARALTQQPERVEAIFVNLHPSELRSELLCATSEPILPEASRVVLEVTERASLSMGPELLEDIRLLRKAGYRIAIDDLGEGYAGLSWLAQIRPDIAKIDMSLVHGAPQSPLKREILASLINVCRRASITVLAEGLETEEEVDLLTSLGCELLQGYFFSRPGPAFPDVANGKSIRGQRGG